MSHINNPMNWINEENAAQEVDIEDASPPSPLSPFKFSEQNFADLLTLSPFEAQSEVPTIQKSSKTTTYLLIVRIICLLRIISSPEKTPH